MRAVCLPRGLVDNKVCAIDDIWSGLRVVRRRDADHTADMSSPTVRRTRRRLRQPARQPARRPDRPCVPLRSSSISGRSTATSTRCRERWPGTSLRPHVKAFKSTALARRLADAGHTSFCAATPREIEGMAEAGLGSDLLLANETLDTERLGRLSDAAASHRRRRFRRDARRCGRAAGSGAVLIDVEVGLPALRVRRRRRRPDSPTGRVRPAWRCAG